MKKEIFKRRMISRNLLLTGFATLAIFLVSCEKFDDKPMADAAMQEDALKRAEASSNSENAKKAPAPGDASIGEIVADYVAAGEFTQLAAAIGYVDSELEAGLGELLTNGTDQYTVFAPLDAAFFALYEALPDVDEITDLPADLVANVLLYHVTEGRRSSNSVVPPKMPRKIETLLGESFMVTSKPMIDAIGSDANFVPGLIDVSASNGIIHVIDSVLLFFE